MNQERGAHAHKNTMRELESSRWFRFIKLIVYLAGGLSALVSVGVFAGGIWSNTHTAMYNADTRTCKEHIAQLSPFDHLAISEDATISSAARDRIREKLIRSPQSFDGRYTSKTGGHSYLTDEELCGHLFAIDWGFPFSFLIISFLILGAFWNVLKYSFFYVYFGTLKPPVK